MGYTPTSSSCLLNSFGFKNGQFDDRGVREYDGIERFLKSTFSINRK